MRPPLIAAAKSSWPQMRRPMWAAAAMLALRHCEAEQIFGGN
jgi:hypothetical protein